MSLRVIDGGVAPGERPIVWNRLPIEAQRVALVIRAAEGTRDRVDLAWDDGRPWLIGIRSVAPADFPVALPAWALHAELLGLPVRDERPGADPFEVADLANQAKARAAALERHKAAREIRRDNRPLPIGSLFDTTTRDQRGLFGD